MEKQKKSLYCFKRTRILWKRCIRLYMGIAAYVRKHADALFGWTIAGLVVSIFLAWLMPKIGVFCGCGCGCLDLPPHIWAWALIVAGALVSFFGKSRMTVVVVALASLIAGVEYLGAAQLILDELGFPIRTLVIFLALNCSVYFIKSAWQFVQSEESKREREEDSLSRSRLYAKIHGRIRTQGDDKGHAYALYGEWGSGKSHLLKYLERRLTQKYLKVKYDDVSPDEDELYQEAHHVCWVSLWHYHSQKEASAAIISALYRTIVGSRWYFSSKVLTSLVRHLPAFVSLGNAQLWDALRSLVAYSDSMEADDEILIVNNRLKKQGLRAVLFIEDAERAELEVIEHLLPLIERLNKIQGLTVICSIDFEELNRKCQKSNAIVGNVQGYLDKIFDMSFSMPDMPPNVSKNFFISYVKKNYPQCPLLAAFAEEATVPFSTPRQIQRVSARLASVEWMYLRSFQKGKCKTPVNSNVLFVAEIVKTLYINEFNHLKKCPNIDIALKNVIDQTENRVELFPWLSEIKSSRSLYVQDRTFNSCVRLLQVSKNNTLLNLSDIMSASYARRNFLLDWDIEYIINNLDKKASLSLASAIHKTLGDLNPENYESSRDDVLSHIVKKILNGDGKHLRYLNSFFENVYAEMPIRTRKHELINCVALSAYTNVNSFACLVDMFFCSTIEGKYDLNDYVFRVLVARAPFYELVALSHLSRQNNDISIGRHVAELLGRSKIELRKLQNLKLDSFCAKGFVDYLHDIYLNENVSPKQLPYGLINFYDNAIPQENKNVIIASMKRRMKHYDNVELFRAALNFIRIEIIDHSRQIVRAPYNSFGFSCIELIINPPDKKEKELLCSELVKKMGSTVAADIRKTQDVLIDLRDRRLSRTSSNHEYAQAVQKTIDALNHMLTLIRQSQRNH